MIGPKSKLSRILSDLEKFYGKADPPLPMDPYEMILYANCGYPASDDRCVKGFTVLKQEVGLDPDVILATPDSKLTTIMRGSGMMPELRATRLKEIADLVKSEFGGDLRTALKLPVRETRKALKTFPTIGDPGVDKILLFTRTLPIAAVPSNCLHVPLRLGFGEETKNYSTSYRSVQRALGEELPEDCDARIRAYSLLKQHGRELCKAARPVCERCPVSARCHYFNSR
jgi:endonuclease III